MVAGASRKERWQRYATSPRCSVSNQCCEILTLSDYVLQKFCQLSAAEGKALSKDVINSDVEKMFKTAVDSKLIASDESISYDEFLKMIKKQLEDNAK